MEVKNVECPICLQILKFDVLYCSDGYLYDRKCFDELDFKSPISREKFTFWLPLEIINDNIVRFKKQSRNNTYLSVYNSSGYDQYGFDIEGFDINGFDKLGFNKDGFNKDKVLIDVDKAKKAISKNPWNIYYANEIVRDNYELIKECIEMEPDTYKYASPNLKNDIELAKFFIQNGGTFDLLDKNMRDDKSVAFLSVQKNP